MIMLQHGHFHVMAKVDMPRGIIQQDLLGSSCDTHVLTREVGSRIYTEGAAVRLVELDAMLLACQV